MAFHASMKFDGVKCVICGEPIRQGTQYTWNRVSDGPKHHRHLACDAEYQRIKQGEQPTATELPLADSESPVSAGPSVISPVSANTAITNGHDDTSLLNLLIGRRLGLIQESLAEELESRLHELEHKPY